MLRPASRLGVPALLVALVACGDAGHGGFEPLDQLTGTWRASHWAVEAEDGSEEWDLVTQAGVALDVVIRGDGTISGVLVAPPAVGSAALRQEFTGTVAVEGPDMTLSFEPDVRLFGQVLPGWDVLYTLAGSTLTWEDTEARWDFDLSGPGAAVDAEMRVVFERIS